MHTESTIGRYVHGTPLCKYNAEEEEGCSRIDKELRCGMNMNYTTLWNDCPDTGLHDTKLIAYLTTYHDIS